MIYFIITKLGSSASRRFEALLRFIHREPLVDGYYKTEDRGNIEGQYLERVEGPVKGRPTRGFSINGSQCILFSPYGDFLANYPDYMKEKLERRREMARWEHVAKEPNSLLNELPMTETDGPFRYEPKHPLPG